MSVTLYVGPLIDPQDQESTELVELVNSELARHGLPVYEEPQRGSEEEEVFWNTITSNSALANMHSVLFSLHQNPELNLPATHLLDPGENAIMYLPFDFAEPIHLAREDDDELILDSCQAMMREIEALAEILGIPLERFPIDRCGDGCEVAEEWERLTQELAEEGALIMNLGWAPATEESVREEIREYSESIGVPEEEIIQQIIEEHGSLEAFAKEDSPEQKSAEAMWALVSHYHAAKMALELKMAFRLG